MSETSLPSNRVLLVDDEPHILSALQRSLRPRLRDLAPHLQLQAVDDPVRALALFTDHAYAVVVSDYRMPRVNGVEVLSRLRALQPLAGRIILSGQVDQLGLSAAINEAQIHRFLTKPWNDEALLDAILQTVQEFSQRAQQAQWVDQAQVSAGQLTRNEAELRRLERMEPGITRVQWDADGAVILDA